MHLSAARNRDLEQSLKLSGVRFVRVGFFCTGRCLIKPELQVLCTDATAEGEIQLGKVDDVMGGVLQPSILLLPSETLRGASHFRLSASTLVQSHSCGRVIRSKTDM